MCEVHKEARTGCQTPGTSVTGRYKLPHEFWELRATSALKSPLSSPFRIYLTF